MKKIKNGNCELIIKRYGVYSILFLTSFIISIIFYVHRNPSDYGVLAYASERILLGQVPYKDFFYIYSPLHAYFLAFFFKLLGTKLYTLIIYFAVFNALLTVIVYEISIIIYEKKKYYVMMALFLFLFFLQPSLYVYSDRLFFGFLSLWFAILYIERRQISFLYFSGLTTGISLLFSQEVGISTIFGIFILMCLYKYLHTGYFDGKNIIPVLSDLLKYFGAVVTIFIPPILFLIFKKVSFHAIFYNLYLYPRTYLHIEQESAFSLYFIKMSFSSIVYGLPLYLEILAYISSVFYLCYICHKKNLEMNHLYVFVILIIGVLLTVSKILYQPNHSHLMFAFLPALFLIVFLIKNIGISDLNKKYKSNKSFKALTRLISCFLIICIILYGHYDTVRYIKDPKNYAKLETDRGQILLGNSERINDINDVVRFLKNNTNSSDSIFITCGGDPLIYFLSERRNPMYYDWFYLNNIPNQNTNQNTGEAKKILEQTKYLIINNDGKTLKDTDVPFFCGENFKNSSALIIKFNAYEIHNSNLINISYN